MTFGKSGHTKSQRSCMLCASRFGQSPLSCSRHARWKERPRQRASGGDVSVSTPRVTCQS